MDHALHYQTVKPPEALSAFVDGFWLLQNHSDSDKEVVILPDGRIDLFFSQSATEPFHVTLLGIGTHPEKATIAAGVKTFAISFKPLAVEYILHHTISDLSDKAENMPPGFWGFDASDLNDFDLFCQKAAQKIQSLLPEATDSRKLHLFDLIYTSQGALTVKALSEQVFWSSRQINRYFNQQYGISLKTFCSILRFHASFQHIKEGDLYPQQPFADQSHFIREIRKLSGVSPKNLYKNPNDRFIQLSIL